MKNEYDISHCAERVSLVSLPRLHTKSHIVPERCSKPVFPIGCLVGKANDAMRRHGSMRFFDDDLDLKGSTLREYNYHAM